MEEFINNKFEDNGLCSLLQQAERMEWRGGRRGRERVTMVLVGFMVHKHHRPHSVEGTLESVNYM